MATIQSTTAVTCTKTTGSDIMSQLSNFLPTGTFLAFEAVAPLFTNNGVCGHVEKIMTGLLLLTFAVINILLSFTDSITVVDGHHYYGVVTVKGLFNPQFQRSGIEGVQGAFYNGEPKYRVSFFDFFNAIISVGVFATLVVVTDPVSSCYFPHLPNTILKSVPILVGIIAGLYFSFAPPPRKGVGYAITGLVSLDTSTVVDLERARSPGTVNNHMAEDSNTATPRPSSATVVEVSSPTHLLSNSQKALTSSSPLQR